jgi:membrane fusion protein (multidrug efflux system)
MIRKILVGVLIALILGGLLAAVKVLQIKTLIAAGAHMVMPPETVASAVAHEEHWPDVLPAVGSVSAEQGAIIAPEIAGTVTEIAFESGATVQPGDLLVKLDSSTEEAQLRAAEAAADLAKINADRSRALRVDKTVSQAELDQAEATFKQALASADALRATVAKKNLRAPFAGKLGIRLVNVGEHVEVGKGLVSLQALTPVFVDFSLPQQELSRLQTGLKVNARVDAYGTNVFSGELVALNPELDATTRNVRIRAKFANADELLRPGMFVRVEVVMPLEKTVLAVPLTAVIAAPYGDSVFVIQPSAEKGATNLVVQQKFIRSGNSKGDFIVVETGLKAGDRVVTAGAFKLRNGMSVVENNDLAPKASETPTPPNT